MNFTSEIIASIATRRRQRPAPRLTPATSKVLDACIAIEEGGDIITIRGIGAITGRTSSSTIHSHVMKLVSLGHLKKSGVRYRLSTPPSQSALLQRFIDELKALTQQGALPPTLAPFASLWH